jgi:hypothetical protein
MKMETQNENYTNRRRFVRRLISLAALGSITSLLLGERLPKVSAAVPDGAIPFYSSGSETTDDTNFHWDDTNHRLGIGTNAPTAMLHVSGTTPNILLGDSANSITSGVLSGTVSGGGASSNGNIVTDDYGTVGGGYKNQAGDNDGDHTNRKYATVGGGAFNAASGAEATVGGGHGNVASGNWGTVCGGSGNASTNQYATVCGGYSNTANKDRATVCGGYDNLASGAGAFVGGGGYNGSTTSGNTASGSASTVSGGFGNQATAGLSTVGGGYQNTASGVGATVSAGENNTASSTITTVGGGYGNKAINAGATVAGGESNTASGDHATVGGGYQNTASASQATVDGGQWNTASGGGATVAGGSNNLAAGDYSFAAGNRAKVGTTPSTHNGTFLFADSKDFDFKSAAANEFAVRATGGFRFVTALDASGNPSRVFTIKPSGDVGVYRYLGIRTTAPTSTLDVAGVYGYSQLRLRTSYTPTHTNDTNGAVGDIAWNDSYFYVKTSVGWKRATLTTF